MHVGWAHGWRTMCRKQVTTFWSTRRVSARLAARLAGSAAGGGQSGSARTLRQRMPAHFCPPYCALLRAPEALWAGGVGKQHDHHDGKEHGGSQGSNQRRLALPQRCRAGAGVHVAGRGVEDGA